MSASSGPTGRQSAAAAAVFALVLVVLAAAAQTLVPAGARAQTQAQTQDQATPPPGAADPAAARERTGGAQTRDDIMRRQRGEPVSNDFRKAQTAPVGKPSPLGPQGPLGTLGGASDADVYRALRFGSADVKVSTNRDLDKILVQDAGMRWLRWRQGPVARYGMWSLGAMAALLALFYLLRGPIRIDGGRSGVMVPRFSEIERFAHWLLASSFLLLAFTGLALLFGRTALIPLIGKDAFAAIAATGKWVHNNVSWAFMLALVLIFVQWASQNIPSRHDLKWLAMGGGFFGGGHPPSRKFNAGQKLIFWSVIVLGASASASGLSLLFPFELPMFAPTFAKINAAGELIGVAPDLPTRLLPHEEMQFAQIWHTIVGFAMMVIILAHIYIGTIGMEGGFEAMGSGVVDRNWADEHHNLWLRELEAQGRVPAPDPPDAPAAPAR